MIDFSRNHRLYRSTLLWIVCAACLFGLRVVASPASIEAYYSRGLFIRIRFILDALFGWWPIPASAVLILLLVSLLLKQLFTSFFKNDGEFHSWQIKVVNSVAVVFRWLAIIGVLFMLLWGFNYGRRSLQEQLQLNPRPLSTEELWQEITATAKYVSIIRTQLPLRDSADYSSLPLFLSSQARVRDAVKKQLQALNYPDDGRVRIREVTPGGLLSWKTSGVYFPLSGEGHVDDGLHSLQKPFVMAHEMLHGFGITDEGSCNFLAWLACTRADNLFIRYSGHLVYYRYLGAALRRRDPARYADFRKELPIAVQADLNSINENLDRYKDIAPKVRDVVYDNYLKSQGVADGMASYSRVIDLVASWRNVPEERQEVPKAADQVPLLD